MQLVFPPPLLGLLFGAVMWLIASSAPALAIDFPHRRLVAIALAAPAITAEAIAVIAFIRAKTTVNPMAPSRTTTLVTTGLYRFSRNPMYLALLVLLSAWALALANPLNVGVLIAFVWYLTEFQIKPEETAMREKFGERYDVYCRKVRRWI